MKILAIGGTGNVGSRVIEELVKRGATVRALVRNKESAGKLSKLAEPAIGDALDPVAVETAMKGVDKLYLLNAVVPDEVTQGLIAYDLAKKLNVKQIVYHSVFKAEAFKDVPHFASKLAIEDAIKAFHVPFTIIRPNYFFQNDESLQPLLTGPGVYPIPFGDPGISPVDMGDIAEASAVALTTDGHLGKTYNLNGPDVLSGSKVASIWSALLGKEIKYLGEDMDASKRTCGRKHRPGQPLTSA